jgi:hypothetical protein
VALHGGTYVTPNVRPFSALPPSNGAVAALHLFLQFIEFMLALRLRSPCHRPLGRRSTVALAALDARCRPPSNYARVGQLYRSEKRLIER